ncbi:MAG: ankyrin repeat domain-containing protein [Candidatus Eremiobacteraeota bacterium]|nr:ankyrin repeat domain-containing protein [Candidatus Eremiobacteraeota bacterium]
MNAAKVVMAIIVTGVILFFLLIIIVLHQGWIANVSHGSYSHCSRNIMEIASALESYAQDHEGSYPLSLAELTPAYLKSIPLCNGNTLHAFCIGPLRFGRLKGKGVDTYSRGYVAGSALNKGAGSYMLCCSGLNHRFAYIQGCQAGPDQPSISSEDKDRLARFKEDKKKEKTAQEVWPLCTAARQGDLSKIADLLKKKPALVNARDSQNFAPLDHAVCNGKVDAVKLIIEKGGDVNGKAVNGFTALHRAIYGNKFEMCKLLVSLGADVNAEDVKGTTPLTMATNTGCNEIAVFLCTRGAQIKDVFDAAKAGDIDKIRHYIEKDPSSSNKKDSWGRTPLHWAAAGGHEEVVEYLILKGSAVTAKDGQGSTPLHLAGANNSLKAVKILVDKGADVNAGDNRLQTPVFRASLKAHKEIVEFLLSKGADINVKDQTGYTPLRWARKFGNKDMESLLTSHGAR